MNTENWLKLLKQDIESRKDSGLIMLEDGTTLDIEMSQKIGDQWFWGFANSDLEDLIPNFCMDSALFAIANDCIVRLMLRIGDREMIEDLVDALKQAFEQFGLPRTQA